MKGFRHKIEMMDIIRNIKYSRIIYTLMAVFLVVTIAGMTLLDTTYPQTHCILTRSAAIIRLLIMGVAFLRLMCGDWKLTKQQKIFFIIYLVLIFTNYYFTKNWMLFDTMFLALCFKDILVDNKIIDIFLYITVTCFILIIVLYYFNFFKKMDIINDRLGTNNRPYLGFIHPNTLGFYMMSLCYLVTLKYFEQSKVLVLFFLCATIVWIYLVPNCLSSVICVLIVASILLIYSITKNVWSKQETKVFLIICSVALVLCSIIIAYFCVFKYEEISKIIKLPGTFWGRFASGFKALNKYGITLFAPKNKNYSTIVIDCAFFNYPTTIGIIPSIIFCCFYIFSMIENVKKNNFILWIIFVSLVLYSFMESTVRSFIISYIYICTYSLTQQKNKNNKIYLIKGV